MSDLKREYGTEQISSLGTIQGIRLRPGMYIGSTSQKGATHCVLETTDNCTDEFSAGFGDTVDVTIYEDTSVEVQDHGRGVPVGLHHEWKKVDGTPENTLTGVFTRLHSGSKFGGNSGYAGGTGGLHGVGMKAVNALSTSFIVTVKREGKIYKQEFSCGKPITDVLEIGTCDKNDTGTNIKYHLDNTIFKMTTEPSCKDLQNRLNELASLNAGLKYKYKNKITNVEKEFYHKDGIIGYVARMVEDKKKLYDNIIFIKGEQTCEKGLVNVDIAFSHLDEDEPSETIKTFANSINTFDGGFHLQGFRNVYRKVLNDFAVKNKLTENGIELKYLLDGIKAVISIKIPDPEFENQTKTKLGSIEAQFAVEEIAERELKKLLKDEVYKNIFTTIITRALQVKEAEEAARKARLSKRMSGKLAKHTLPGKLADCENKNGYTEIFMVEGASAGGSAKNGRYSEFQAILALRGK